MKFIHIGDLHIGKVVHEYSMLEDQKHALNSLLELIKEEEPNGLIIAGDLYDRSVPPSDAVEVLSDFFTSVLKETNTKIFTIAGNHDSSERLSFLQKILEDKGLYIEGSFKGEVKCIPCTNGNESIYIYLLPYTDPAQARKLYKDPSIKSHEDALSRILKDVEVNSPSIIVSHAYVGTSQMESSDSERPLSIGAAEIVNPKIFEKFSYTALGHLHKAQRVGSDTIRYSGSLLKYSVSEANHKKQVTIVNIDNYGNVDTQLRELSILRDLRIKRGYLNEIITPGNYEGENLSDYVFVELLDEGELVDPIGTLRGVYSNVLGLRKVISTKDEVELNDYKSYREKGIRELFVDFYLEFNDEFNEDRKESLEKYIDNTLEEVIR
ncbi:MAG: exonuclease SbcCD subunit D [Clostridium sp.]